MKRALFAAVSCFLAASVSAFEQSSPIGLRLPAAVTLAPSAQLAALPASVSAVNAAEVLSPLAAPSIAPAAVAPKAQALSSIQESGVIQAAQKGGDANALSAASMKLFDNDGAKSGIEDAVSASPSAPRWRSFLGKAAATASAVMTVPALAAAQTPASAPNADGNLAAGLIFGGIAFTAVGYMLYDNLFGDRAERKAAKDYVAKNAAAIRTLPGVAKVKTETVLTSPWSSGPGVAVYYGLGADRDVIEAALPKAEGVTVNVMPAYSEKEAARDYVAKAGDKIRAIPGVADVKATDVFAGYTPGLMAGMIYKPGVRIRYNEGADTKAIEAAIPPAGNGVSVVLEPR